MAPPRFAPTGRRLGVPPGVRVIDAGSVPPGVRVIDANSPLPSGVRVIDAGQSSGGSGGLFGTNIGPREGFRSIYRRPLSTLGAVFRVLGVGENVAVGALQSGVEDFRTLLKAPTPEKALAAVSPWLWIAAHAPDNFVEVKNAVQENRTYEGWIRESQEPGNFLYDNAFVIGLGLSIFGDPTTYITFGTTSASKVAGQKLLAASYMSSADEATDAILTGVIRRTGENASDYANDYDRIFHRIHTDAKRPYTVGDSLEAVKRADRGQLPDISDQWIKAVGITPRGPVRRTARKAFARGGQGIRFGGAEIPGSRQIAPAFGKMMGKVPGAPDRESLIETFKHVIPNDKLLRVTEDATRAVAMAEFTRANQFMAMARTGAFEDALEHFALDPIRARRALGAPYLARAQVAVRNIFDDVPLAVPKKDRMNLFKSGHRPTGKYSLALKDMRTAAYKTRDRLLQDAEDMGFTEHGLDSLRSNWDDLARSLDDPVDVLARWEASVVGTMAAHNTIEQIMTNPLLARPVLEGADDLARIEDDILDLNERIARATARMNEKGLSNRARMARSGQLQVLQEKSQTLAYNWNVAKARITEQVSGKTIELPPNYTDEVIETPEWIPDVVVRKGDGWTGVFAREEKAGHSLALRIPTDKEIEDSPWKAFARLYVEPEKPHRVWIGTSGMDHEDVLNTAFDMTVKAEKAGLPQPPNPEGWLQSTIVFEKGQVARINLSAFMESGELGGASAKELGMTPAAYQKLVDKVTSDVESFYKSAKPQTRVDKANVRVGGVLDEDAARAAFHENAVPFKWRGKKYFVPAPIEQALTELRNPQLVDKEIRKWFRAINFTQNKWKILATSVNPRFHVMNHIGGVWNNMLGGVYNPGDYAQQWTSLFRQRIGRMDDESSMGKMLGPLKGRIDQDKLARDRELLDAYDARHAGGGFIAHETHPEFQEMKRSSKLQSKKGKAFQVTRRAYAGTVIPLAVAPDEWVPDEIEDSPLFNPLLAVAAGLPELARTGRYVANDVETVLRETPMRVAAKDPSYYQLMDAFSLAPPVHFGRWMGETDIGRSQMGRELVWDIGAANAIRYQFDYSNLTNFERYFAKTVFPFYTFNKNNFVLQVQEVAQRPRFLAVTSDVINYLGQVTATEENQAFQDILPEYFDKLAMFRVPVPGFMRDFMGLPQDQDLYLNPTIPFASLNLFPPLWEITNDESLTPTNHRWLQMFAPLFGSIGPNAILPGFKPMLEYSIGYNLGLARPIDYQTLQSGGWRHSYREAPNFMRYLPKQLQNTFGAYKDPTTGQLMMDSSMAYVAEQMASPFINASGDIFNWGQGGVESDRTRANNFAFITGIRLTPIDPLRLQRSMLYRIENFLEGEKANAKRRGEPFSREDNTMLSRVRAQLKGVELEWDRKQGALYGG